MTALLALASAGLFGTSDFLGGFASRRSQALVVATVANVAGLPVLILAVAVVPFEEVRGADLGWGAVGGAFGALGLVGLYAALGRGRMGVVAPTTAVVAALVPVAYDLSVGDPLEAVNLSGIAVALVAIPFLAPSSADRVGAGDGGRQVLLLALAAGVGFGVFGVCLSFTESSSGMWPLVGARAVSIPLLAGTTLAVHGRRSRLPAGDLRISVAAGLIEMLANAFVLAAIQRGPLAVAAVLSALYPAVTALLAKAILGETLSASQRLGVGGALAAVVLIAIPG